MSAVSEIFWDKRSRKYDDKIRQHDSGYEKTVGRLRSLLDASDLVLDFACASGEIALDIAPHVRQVRGIDSSARMIELAKRKARDRGVHNAAFHRADAFDGRLETGSFSVVVAFNIFHLLDDAPAVLARLQDLLVPGGLLISKTPCLGEWSRFLRPLIGLAQRVGWAPAIRSFKAPELESLVSRNFEIRGSEVWDEKNRIQWIVGRNRAWPPASRQGI